MRIWLLLTKQLMTIAISHSTSRWLKSTLRYGLPALENKLQGNFAKGQGSSYRPAVLYEITLPSHIFFGMYIGH